MDELYKIRAAYLKIKGGVCRYTGKSMEPTLKEGYTLKITPSEVADLRKGDLIVYDNGGSRGACHRFLRNVSIKGKTYLMEKGDNNLLPWFIEESCLLGRVKEVYDQEGVMVNFERLSPRFFFLNMYAFFWIIFFIRFKFKT